LAPPSAWCRMISDLRCTRRCSSARHGASAFTLWGEPLIIARRKIQYTTYPGSFEIFAHLRRLPRDGADHASPIWDCFRLTWQRLRLAKRHSLATGSDVRVTLPRTTRCGRLRLCCVGRPAGWAGRILWDARSAFQWSPACRLGPMPAAATVFRSRSTGRRTGPGTMPPHAGAASLTVRFTDAAVVT
jgi:hypothetical protein